MNISGINDIQVDYPIDGFDIVISASLTLVSNTLLCLIFAYLHSVTLAKECLLLRLYKEFVIVLVLCSCLGNCLSIGIYTYGYPMNWIPATIITGCLRIGTIILLLLANVVHLLKYRMNKEKMLDPPMPWGDDEQRGMIWIRVFCWGLSAGFVITMYVCGIHTALYHSSIGDDFDRSIPIIHSGFNIFLVATCTIFIIGENYYLKTNDGQAFDPVVSRRLKYLVLGFVFALLFSAISNIFIQTTLVPLSIWIQKKRFVLMLIVEIVMAICTILNSDQLRSYISKLMTTIYEQAFFLNIYLAPLFLSIIINGGIYIVYKVLDI